MTSYRNTNEWRDYNAFDQSANMSWSDQWSSHLPSHFAFSLRDEAWNGAIDRATIQDPLDNITSTTLDSCSNGIVHDPQSHVAPLTSAWADNSTMLDPNFVRQQKPKQFFVKGKVFRALWAQPAGEQNPYVQNPSKRYRNHASSGSSSNNTIWVGNRGGKVFQDVKLFVVVREGHNYCTAVQITSYQGQGLGKYDVAKKEHALVYAGNLPPEFLQDESPNIGEPGILPIPIGIVPDVVNGHPLHLKKSSRINFGKSYTIEHNILVHSFGRVHEGSLDSMISQYLSVHNPPWNFGLPKLLSHKQDAFRDSTANFSKDLSIAVYKVISGTGVQGIEEAAEYLIRSSEFYYEGKVFTAKGCKESWPVSEPPGRQKKKGMSKSLPSVITEEVEGFDENGSALIGQKLWFVVIKSGRSSCLCLRILSYENQGVAQEYALDQHSVVYIGKKRPKMTPTEISDRGNGTRLKESIRVIPFDRRSELLPTHRIRYSTLYRVHHNVLACPFGKIHEEFNWYLKQQTRAHFREMEQENQIPPGISSRQMWKETLEQLSSSESDECNALEDEDSFVLRSDIPAPDHPKPMFNNGDRVLLPVKDKPFARARFRPLLVKESKLIASSWRWEYKLTYEKHEGEFAGGMLFAEEKLIGDQLS